MPTEQLINIINISDNPIIKLLKNNFATLKSVNKIILDVFSALKKAPKLLLDLLRADYYLFVLLGLGRGKITQFFIFLLEKLNLDVSHLKSIVDELNSENIEPISISSSEFNNLKGFLYSKPSNNKELININEYNTVIHKMLDIAIALKPTLLDVLSELSDMVISKHIDEERISKLVTKVYSLNNYIVSDYEIKTLFTTLFNKTKFVEKADKEIIGIITSAIIIMRD